jgi:hypothetical protein
MTRRGGGQRPRGSSETSTSMSRYTQYLINMWELGEVGKQNSIKFGHS